MSADTISAKQVMELRERTGSGLMECKAALLKAKGDIELAIQHMREAGKAKADKKASRVAAEGMIAVAHSQDKKTAYMIELNSETDFVAKDIILWKKRVKHWLQSSGKISKFVVCKYCMPLVSLVRTPMVLR